MTAPLGHGSPTPGAAKPNPSEPQLLPAPCQQKENHFPFLASLPAQRDWRGRNVSKLTGMLVLGFLSCVCYCLKPVSQETGICRCRAGAAASCLSLSPWMGYLLSSLCPGSVHSDLTMFGHGGLPQMGTKGRFPGDRAGLGAQAASWSSGGPLAGGGGGRAESQRLRETPGHRGL